MAEKEDKKSEAKESPPQAAAPARAEEKKDAPTAKGGLMKNTPVLLGAVMFIEAIVLFGGMKFLGGGAPHVVQGASIASPDDKHGDGGGGATSKPDATRLTEIPIVHSKWINRQSGRSIIYDVQIVAAVKSDHAEKVKQTIEARKSYIQDRIRTIVAQSDPEKLGGGTEPGLETLRRQVKYQLDEIIGDGMIDEVLVPTCTPYRADF